MLLELGDAFVDGGHVHLGHERGPLILSLYGPAGEVRVGDENGPRLTPFFEETRKDLMRRMFQIVPTGRAGVTYLQGDEFWSTWTFFARFEGPDRDARQLETRTARIALVRFRDIPDDWSVQVVIDGVCAEAELRGYIATRIARHRLLPPYARQQAPSRGQLN